MSNPYNVNVEPPDPISFLRTISDTDFENNSVCDLSGSGGADGSSSPRRNQEEAPARERPPPGEDWPYRVSDVSELYLLFPNIK